MARGERGCIKFSSKLCVTRTRPFLRHAATRMEVQEDFRREGTRYDGAVHPNKVRTCFTCGSDCRAGNLVLRNSNDDYYYRYFWAGVRRWLDGRGKRLCVTMQSEPVEDSTMLRYSPAGSPWSQRILTPIVFPVVFCDNRDNHCDNHCDNHT